MGAGTHDRFSDSSCSDTVWPMSDLGSGQDLAEHGTFVAGALAIFYAARAGLRALGLRIAPAREPKEPKSGSFTDLITMVSTLTEKVDAISSAVADLKLEILKEIGTDRIAAARLRSEFDALHGHVGRMDRRIESLQKLFSNLVQQVGDLRANSRTGVSGEHKALPFVEEAEEAP